MNPSRLQGEPGSCPIDPATQDRWGRRIAAFREAFELVPYSADRKWSWTGYNAEAEPLSFEELQGKFRYLRPLQRTRNSTEADPDIDIGVKNR